MRKLILLSVVLCLVLSCAAVAQAQSSASASSGPPKVLQIYREEVKPGKSAAHAVVEAGWPAAFARANWPVHYVAMTSTTGPSEAWYVTGYESFAAIEKDQQAVEKATVLNATLEQLSARDGELLSSTRSVTAVHRPDLSYRSGSVNVAEARYVRVATVRVRLGHADAFVERQKTAMAAHDKANTGVHWTVYEVVGGMPAGTYLIFSSMKSLAEADVDVSKAFREAMGEENFAKRMQFARDSLLFVESNIFAFSPKQSYVSKEWVAANPDFWAPKTGAQVAGKKPTGAKTVPAATKPPQQ